MTSPSAAQFPYVDRNPAQPGSALMPFLPITLTLRKRSISVLALVDSGAAVSVLPYDLGVRLGADWSQQKARLQLTGNLARSEARALIVAGSFGPFSSVRLAFAWTQDNTVSAILGQTNFFDQFDVCFSRARAMFEVKPSSGPAQSAGRKPKRTKPAPPTP